MSVDGPFFEQVFCGPMGNCVYFVGDRRSKQAFLVDPAFEPLELHRRLGEAGFEVVAVLATHAHPDHVGGEVFGMQIPGLRELFREVRIPVHIHSSEREILLRQTGIDDALVRVFEDGATLPLGDLEIDVLHTPGHSPGSVGFLLGRETTSPILIAGDTLFVQGVGRVDLPGSDPEQLFHSLQRLKELPPETRVFPGHNYGPAPSSTIRRELETNPYLRVASLAQWRSLMVGG